jgi:deazaflavin-dependent oxidoreductase (nitroreductase family)
MEVTLTTTGRNTGRAHEVVLNGFADGGRLVVVGSYGGRDYDPDWVSNLRRAPEVEVGRGGKTGRYLAHEAEGAERARLWQLVTAAFPLYETYQQRTKRLIPLFSLEPIGTD